MEINVGGAPAGASEAKRTLHKWTPAEKALLLELAKSDLSLRDCARIMGKTDGQVAGQSMRLHIQFRGGRQRPVASGGRADIEARSRWRWRIQSPKPTVALLKHGRDQRKIGSKVLKGRWRGFPIYTLTLEERATCPRSCTEWLTCYGNHMQLAARWKHGPALTNKLALELADLQDRHPQGFVVRLHILGDFYSPAYVEFWETALATFPALNVFGYTARQASDPIAQLIADLRDSQWRRFAVRTSGAAAGPRTRVVESPVGINKREAIVCPVETGKASHCGACTLCWASQKPIVFVRH